MTHETPIEPPVRNVRQRVRDRLGPKGGEYLALVLISTAVLAVLVALLVQQLQQLV